MESLAPLDAANAATAAAKPDAPSVKHQLQQQLCESTDHAIRILLACGGKKDVILNQILNELIHSKQLEASIQWYQQREI